MISLGSGADPGSHCVCFSRTLLVSRRFREIRFFSAAPEVEKRICGGLSARPLLSVPHIMSDESSCYYHGYVLAEMAVRQTRAYFLDKFGHLTDNSAIGLALCPFGDQGWLVSRGGAPDGSGIREVTSGIPPRRVEQVRRENGPEVRWGGGVRKYGQTRPQRAPIRTHEMDPPTRSRKVFAPASRTRAPDRRRGLWIDRPRPPQPIGHPANSDDRSRTCAKNTSQKMASENTRFHVRRSHICTKQQLLAKAAPLASASLGEPAKTR